MTRNKQVCRVKHVCVIASNVLPMYNKYIHACLSGKPVKKRRTPAAAASVGRFISAFLVAAVSAVKLSAGMRSIIHSPVDDGTRFYCTLLYPTILT